MKMNKWSISRIILPVLLIGNMLLAPAAMASTAAYDADKAQIDKEFNIVKLVSLADRDRYKQQVEADIKYLSDLLKQDYLKLEKKHPRDLGDGLARTGYEDSIRPGNIMGSMGTYQSSYKRGLEIYNKAVGEGSGYDKGALSMYEEKIDPGGGYFMDSALADYTNAVKKGEDNEQIRQEVLTEIKTEREKRYKEILDRRNRTVKDITEMRDKTVEQIMKHRKNVYGEAPIKIKPLVIAFDPVKVIVNGELLKFTQPPVIVNGTILVQMRTIFEKMGAKVTTSADGSIKVSKAGTEIVLRLNSNEALVNGTAQQLETPAQKVGGSAMVPLKFCVQALGEELYWDELTQTAVIETGGKK